MKSDAHWTAIAGFWLAIIGIIATVVIGILELKKDDRNPRRGKKPGVERSNRPDGTPDVETTKPKEQPAETPAAG